MGLTRCLTRTITARGVVAAFVIFVLLSVSPTSAGSSTGQPQSSAAVKQQDAPSGVPPQVVTDVTASVGLVRSAGGTGSGWIAAPDTVITNLHVAKAGSGDIYVDFSDGQRVECYSAVATREMDLAIVRCETGLRAPIDLDTAIPEQGLPVAVVGYPLGVGPKETQGVITGERIVVRKIETVRFTAEIQPGNSGSPVFDANGNVRAVATFSGGLGVPIAELVPLLERAESYPITKQGAEWRIRIRRSMVVGVSTLALAWFFARRYGRRNPRKVAIRWTITMVLLTLLVTQILFSAFGPATFI
ncbi:MAG TPA: serine protease [Microthrixaceae bacterium]|nr:serine protease [Microthrixaceae bacterium]